MIGAAPMTGDRLVESTYGFTAGLLTGLICGGALALLFAPKAGNELRGELNEGMSSMRDEMGRRYRTVADRASAGFEQAKGAAQGMATTARDFAQSKMQQGRDAVDRATEH